jgi:hypothetical protein
MPQTHKWLNIFILSGEAKLHRGLYEKQYTSSFKIRENPRHGENAENNNPGKPLITKRILLNDAKVLSVRETEQGQDRRPRQIA